ncbi:carboxylate-amine ligase [Vannielia litorea]|uniref:Putative glutamate--cysteine ligase 2 n=1 Tax=Vannielia litorea TaxID=1217970 RepID=A0A1N6IMR7_9RHOB|nr:carboxylate-amine ligase [Vannielia litorea]SIO33263.1 carboxylate-amine ligase [Vannielia litorea]
MAVTTPSFTLGIEEEYLLVDRDTLDLARAPEALMEACTAELSEQVSPEFLQCQIEIGTRVCENIGAAREELKRLRGTVARCAAAFNLAPIAVSCHPFADWKDQPHTDRERYNALSQDLGGVVRRMLICGMHVHVGIEDDDLRADLLPQLSYFLPHLLALSASSPFWQGQDTGLSSYRLTVFDNLPRTGLPPTFESFTEYERTVQVLIDLGVIEDSTKIWWDLRPSHRFPTLETRICDVSPRLEDTLTLAATTQALLRMLWRLRTRNLRWRRYDRFLIMENRWRAQRYGVSEGLIDFGAREIIPMATLASELVDILAEDAQALGSEAEIARLPEIVAKGNAADRQRAVYAGHMKAGASHGAAMRGVVESLVDEFAEGV